MWCIHEWKHGITQDWNMGICTGQELTRYVRILYYKQEPGSGIDNIWVRAQNWVPGISGVMWVWQWWMPWLGTSWSLSVYVTWVLWDITVFPLKDLIPRSWGMQHDGCNHGEWQSSEINSEEKAPGDIRWVRVTRDLHFSLQLLL